MTFGFRLRRSLLRLSAAMALIGTSQLSACITGPDQLGGSELQYYGGPSPSPGGNFNPVAGRPN